MVVGLLGSAFGVWRRGVREGWDAVGMRTDALVPIADGIAVVVYFCGAFKDDNVAGSERVER